MKMFDTKGMEPSVVMIMDGSIPTNEVTPIPVTPKNLHKTYV